MDINQVVKQLEWMDEERRRDKSVITAFQEKVNDYSDKLQAANQRVKALDEEVKRLSVQVGRLNQFDGALVQQRVEIRRMMDESEKKMARSRDDNDKVLRGEIKGLQNLIEELSNKFDQIQEVKRELQAERNERLALERTLNDLNLRLDDFGHIIEDYGRANRLYEESRRQESKQMDGLQGEVIAFRRRLDERRSEIEAMGVNLNRVETRLGDLLSLEAGRQTDQQQFIEQQNILQVEREKILKDWIKRLEIFEKQAEEIQSQIQILDTTHRMVKRSQESVDVIAERMERRINEITELQRLTEERFRQEWTTFKGDDQKRWADYSLSQEERQNELMRQADKSTSRFVSLEDQFYIMRGLIIQMNSQSEKGLQTFFTLAHEWLETYQRLKGLEK